MPNISIIARIADSERVKRNVKRENGKGERYERRTETWFATERGHLVLRESDMRHEFAAISAEGKEHSVRHKPDNPRALKEVLLAGLGVPLIVDMRRETWHLVGVDAHFDDVEGLGSFVELEAIDQGDETDEDLRKRCHAMLHLLGIPESDLIDGRYADLLR